MAAEKKLKNQFYREFIEEYRNHPCLWDATLLAYGNLMQAENAVSALLRVYKKFYPQAVRSDVLKRMRFFRRNYYKEKQKSTSSESRARNNDVYMTSFWWLDLLNFLPDTPPDGIETKLLALLEPYVSASDGRSPDASGMSSTPIAELQFSPSSLGFDCAASTSGKRSFPEEGPFPGEITNTRSKGLFEASASSLSFSPSATPNLGKTGSNTSGSFEKDEFYNVGVNVAAKLRRLPPEQKVFAEKLINEVLYLAELGKLLNSYQIFNARCGI